MELQPGVPVLDVHVVKTTPEPLELTGPAGRVRMIPFRGEVTGSLFTGIVEPCGVDTQTTDLAGVRHMSARYMLTGTDCAGNPCRIYVENSGQFAHDTVPHPFTTVPVFRTDSPVLAPLLHTGRFTGRGVQREDGLHILFFPA